MSLKCAIVCKQGKSNSEKYFANAKIIIDSADYLWYSIVREKHFKKPNGKIPNYTIFWEDTTMKKNFFARRLMVLGLTAILALGSTITAQASTTDTPTIARTKAWDSIEHSLGGVPESVRKIEYQGSTFYLAPDVSDGDFTAVLAAGPEAVRLKPPTDNGKLYQYPVYILWNNDKTVLLVHPITFSYDNVLEPVSTPASSPTSQTGTQPVSAESRKALTGQEAIDYMLSDEYANAVRDEFYKLLNEHRVANGLRELDVNLELQDYADIRADEQRTRGGHTRPSGTAAGSGWHNSKNNLNTRYAENALACGAIGADPLSTARGIFSIWKNSEGHNKHMLYNFDTRITMAFGIAPELDKDGFVTSGAIFATGY